MIVKRWKKSGKKKRTPRLFILVISGISLVCLFLSSLWLYSSSSTVRISSSIYRDIVSARADPLEEALGNYNDDPSIQEDARPKVAIIIDDLGYDPDLAFSFIQLDLPLCFSVLPHAPFTGLVVQEANDEGCEVMLHLPMEPKDYPSVDPGPGALFLSMAEHEIIEILDQDLREVPGARGVNNHMGSSFTENRDKMLVVLKELKKRRLFYVDSLTTSGTVGFDLAREIGLAAARRSVFIDNDLTPKAIRKQMEQLLSIARRSGSAIGIGHPHKETLRVLEEYYSRVKHEFQVVPVSALVM